MDRQFVYAGQIPLDTDLLSTNRNVLIALGLMAQDIFGSATVVGGLSCGPSTPPALTVSVGAGRLYSLQNVDSTAYSDLAPDTVHQIVKQGILLDASTLACAAPVTNGYSINYLIECTYQDLDTNSTVLSYYNASNPNSPWSGPGGLGASQPTTRAGRIVLQAKAGIPAPTGTQLTPAPDVGYIGLYFVTVAFGQTTILSGNIVQYPGAPFLAGGLLSQTQGDARYLKLAGGTLTGTLIGPNAVFTSMTVNGVSAQNAAVLTTGSLLPAVVPLSAVSQWQASLVFDWSQITTGVKNADQLNGAIAGPSGGFLAGALAKYDPAGNLFMKYANVASANGENPAISQVLVTNGSDGYARKATLAWLSSQMSLSAIGGVVTSAQVPLSVVAQYQAQLKCRNIGGLASTLVTLAADPGTVPAGNPGDVFEYY